MSVADQKRAGSRDDVDEVEDVKVGQEQAERKQRPAWWGGATD